MPLIKTPAEILAQLRPERMSPSMQEQQRPQTTSSSMNDSTMYPRDPELTYELGTSSTTPQAHFLSSRMTVTPPTTFSGIVASPGLFLAASKFSPGSGVLYNSSQSHSLSSRMTVTPPTDYSKSAASTSSTPAALKFRPGPVEVALSKSPQSNSLPSRPIESTQAEHSESEGSTDSQPAGPKLVAVLVNTWTTLPSHPLSSGSSKTPPTEHTQGSIATTASHPAAPQASMEKTIAKLWEAHQNEWRHLSIPRPVSVREPQPPQPTPAQPAQLLQAILGEGIRLETANRYHSSLINEQYFDIPPDTLISFPPTQIPIALQSINFALYRSPAMRLQLTVAIRLYIRWPEDRILPESLIAIVAQGLVLLPGQKIEEGCILGSLNTGEHVMHPDICRLTQEVIADRELWTFRAWYAYRAWGERCYLMGMGGIVCPILVLGEETAERSVVSYLNEWWPHLQLRKGAGDESLARDKHLVLPNHGFDIC